MSEATQSSIAEIYPALHNLALQALPPTLAEAQQRHLGTLSKVAEIFFSTASAVSSKQIDLLRGETEQLTTDARLFAAAKAPAVLVTEQFAATRGAVERAVVGLREINDIARDGAYQLFAVLADSLRQNVNSSGGRPDKAGKTPALPARAA
jgi:hypothetical protein